MATVTLRPVYDSTYSENNPVGASEHYDCVDDITSDGDSTYLSNNNTSSVKKDYFTFGSSGIGAGATINSVTLYIVSKTTATGRLLTYTAQRSFYLSGVEYNYGGSVTTSYSTYSTNLTLNPNSGLAWTVSEVDNIIAGVAQLASGCEVRTTQVYLVIDYTGGSGTPSTDAIMFGTS